MLGNLFGFVLIVAGALMTLGGAFGLLLRYRHGEDVFWLLGLDGLQAVLAGLTVAALGLFLLVMQNLRRHYLNMYLRRLEAGSTEPEKRQV